MMCFVLIVIFFEVHLDDVLNTPSLIRAKLSRKFKVKTLWLLRTNSMTVYFVPEAVIG